ncbi:MAG: hypothetical protein EBR09_00345 [Proteobacteria bacterium]|nr:hypothetical protein [Pseudomonadota bacterium]
MSGCGHSVLTKISKLIAFILSLASFQGPGEAAEYKSAQNREKTAVPKSALPAPSLDSNSEYLKVFEQFEALQSSGQREKLVSRSYFQSLSWIGRTACINYVCGVMKTDSCRQVLQTGLSDEALVVRDHALRITIASGYFNAQEKKSASEMVIGDSRNYRKGRPFWIVERAREFLVADSGGSAGR